MIVFKKIEIEFKNREKDNMVQTKEEKAAYMKIWYENKKANMTDEQKEEHREKQSAYNKSPARRKSYRIANWKQRGIVVPDNLSKKSQL